MSHIGVAIFAMEPAWYHGNIPRAAAEERLANQNRGTYLFRDSETRLGYALSVRITAKTKHFIVEADEKGTFRLMGKPGEFATVDGLIAHFASTPVSTSDQAYLLLPCPKRASVDTPSPGASEDAPAVAEPTPAPATAAAPTLLDESEDHYVQMLKGVPVNTEALQQAKEAARRKSVHAPLPQTPVAQSRKSEVLLS